MNRKKVLRVVIIVVAAFIVLYGCGWFLWQKHFNPYRDTITSFEYSLPLEEELTVEQAQRDITYVYSKLAGQHPMWLEDNAPRVEDVKDLYVDALADLSIDEDGVVTVMDVWRAVSRMTAALGDGHTSVWWQSPNQHFIDNLVMYEAGGRPVAVNGIPIEDVIERFRPLSSYETEDYFLDGIFGSRLIREHYLNLIDIDTSTGVHFTCKKDNGTLYDCWYNFVPADRILMNDDSSNQDEAWVSYSVYPEEDLAVFTLEECNWNDEYKMALQAFFEDVAASGVTNIAVDLRGNGGGNSMVANEFIRYLPADSYESWMCDVRFGPYLRKFRNMGQKNTHAFPVFNGTVFVLTDVRTFSAAMDFSMLIKDNNLGFIVGEASGNKPASYGDCLNYQLPETKLGLSVSYKKWYRVDQTDPEGLIEPDYPCDPDEALDEVKRIIAARR